MEVKEERKQEEGIRLKESNVNNGVIAVETNEASKAKTVDNQPIIDNPEAVNSIIETCTKCGIKNFYLSTSKKIDVHVGIGVNYKGVNGTIGVKVGKDDGIQFGF